MYLFNNPINGVKRKTNLDIRIRNILALRILYDTGMRSGELLGIRLQDFHFASGGEPAILSVTRYHDDPHDDRNQQPVAKTLERPIPIDEALADFISNYLKECRSKVPNVGFNDIDFLLVSHRKGKRQGKALTANGLISGINNLIKQRPALKGLHPHLLRHDWNYRFSLKADNLGYSEEEERSSREFLMGWVPGSQSSFRYNRRRIQEQAFKLGLQLSSHTSSRKPKDE